MGGLWGVPACPPPLILPGGGPGLQVGAGGAAGSGQLQPAGAEHMEEAADPKIPRGHVRRGSASLGGGTRAWGGHYRLGGVTHNPFTPPKFPAARRKSPKRPRPRKPKWGRSNGTSGGGSKRGPPRLYPHPPQPPLRPPRLLLWPPRLPPRPPRALPGGSGHGAWPPWGLPCAWGGATSAGGGCKPSASTPGACATGSCCGNGEGGAR